MNSLKEDFKNLLGSSIENDEEKLKKFDKKLKKLKTFIPDVEKELAKRSHFC
jgi:hypothetical protein